MVGLACDATAHAEELQFTYVESGSGAVDFSFLQDSNPTAQYYDLGWDVQVGVSDWTGNVGPFSDVVWYPTAAAGGITAWTPDSSVYLDGPQVYSGSEQAPVFAPGVFADFSDVNNGLTGTLTVTEASLGSGAPEPATWAMLLIGLGATGAAMRTARRRDATTLTVA